MEPAAPGTEEDLRDLLVSKKTSEQERLLSIKAYLPNGDFGNVFELTYINGCEQWYCNVCKCPIMGRVFYHEGGKRHSLNMSLGNNDFKSQSPTPAPQEDARPTEEISSIKVAPGEPVPPGFEGEITKVAQIQERLDSFRSGSLLGLEYLLEIQDYDHEKEPSYLCLLCGKKGDPRTVIAHLVSYNHIQSYLQRHFQKTYTALAPFLTRQYKKNWQDTVNKIAEAIETKYGRLLPHPVDAETFEKKKEELYSLVYLGPHFSEKNGVTFESLVNRDEITKVLEGDNSKDYGGPIKNAPKKRSPSPPVVNKPKKPKPVTTSAGGPRRRSLSSVSSISSSDLSDFDEKKISKSKPSEHRKKIPYERRRSRSRSRSPIARDRRQPYSRRSPPKGRSGYRGRDQSMPWNRPDYVRSTRNDTPNESRRKVKVKDDKMEEFKRLATAIENDMDKVLKQHKTNPEKHPQYNDEWKIFWKKRYNELQAEGKDASKYDFKPEWILYWNDKIVELHKHEVRNKIEALRKRLGVTEPTPISFKIGSKRRNTAQDSKLAPMASQPDQDHEVIIIDDKDDDSLGSKRSRTPIKTRSPQRLNSPRSSQSRRRSKSPKKSRSPRKSRPRSHSPWESEPTPRSKAPSKRLSLERVSSPEKEGDVLTDTSREWYSTRDRSRDRGPSYGHREYISAEREYRTDQKSWERDISYHRETRRDMYKPPPFMRDVTREPFDYNKHGNVKSVKPEPPEEEDDANVNTVAVLRLLTALEDKLGSLGPKIIDMLATALAMEKKEPNSSENLLDNEINCVLFETVKEKLKGALHAGLVDFHQEKAYKTAIKKIASLIHLAGQRKVEKANPTVDPVKVPGIGTVDKAAIAKQIATALVLQGKTDVSHTELEQLINAVVGMAEASKNSGKPITTASFLESLSKKEEPMVKLVSSSPPPSTSVETQSNTDAIEGLSDSDLQTLLQNFKDLSTEEQHGLITYLKKMEAKEPERVEKLRRYVNLGQEENVKETGRISPFSRKLKNVEENVDVDNNEYDYFDDDKIEDVDESKKVKVEEVKVSKVKIDSDEEEYSYEDVFKAANKNVEESKIVKEKEESLKKGAKTSESDVLNDAKALIANIMGSIASKTNPRINSPIVDSLNIEKAPLNLPVSQPISSQYVPPSNQPQPSSLPSYTTPVMQTNVSTTVRPNQNAPIRPNSSSGPRPPIINQNVQYPIKNNPYNSYGPPYGNNYNFQNQLKHNPRFNQPRGYYPNPNNNNRGGGNFGKRW